jgi:2-amino-4-hydroxy-6-hydroxymethyldihydropteridine diphosphokinase
MPVYICLGSNLGDRKTNIDNAISGLESRGVSILKKSSIYETEPVGMMAQPLFYNMCAEAETGLEPAALLAAAKEVERALGRGKGVKWGPRIIDIDILFYDNIILDGKDLKIPHPELENRKFVLVPMAEIAENFVHPVYNISIKEMLKKKVFREKVIKLSGNRG